MITYKIGPKKSEHTSISDEIIVRFLIATLWPIIFLVWPIIILQLMDRHEEKIRKYGIMTLIINKIIYRVRYKK
jgi:hypothetical protein